MTTLTLDALKAIPIPRDLGGHPALYFVNTVEFRGSDHPVDFLHRYVDVAAWAWRAGILDDEHALIQLAQTENADDAFQFALELRTSLYELFRAVVEERPTPLEALALLDRAVIAAVQHRHLYVIDGVIRWEWRSQPDAFRPLWQVSMAAADLLTGEMLHKVKQCPNCGWFFIDTSRNHSRRWCSMDFCGSVEKSRRQYKRRQAQASQSG